MAILLRFPKPSLLISKIAAVILSAAAVAFILARFAVPYSIAAAPLFWSLSRFVLSPPYLFITVHVIIVAIWKLSDQNSNGKPSTAVDEVENRNATPLKTVTDESDAVTPGSAESCVTTNSEEEKAVSSRLEFEDEEFEDEETEDAEDTWREVVMKQIATWEKSSNTVAVVADVAAEITGEQTVKRSVMMTEMMAEGNEEMNRRFEAFIKKNYDQIRSY